MKPEEQRLLEAFRAAVAKKQDPVERKQLEEKLAVLERDFATEPWRDPNPAQTDALLLKAKRTIFWGRFAIAAFVVALLGVVAWFWGHALGFF